MTYCFVILLYSLEFISLCLVNRHFYFSKVPPSVAGAEIPSEVSVLEGENVELVCNANGIPTPVIQWLRDGRPITSSETERIRYVYKESLQH